MTPRPAQLVCLRPAPRRAGFTMLEILMAMGVFALGFVFIAALFPAAVILQKQTTDNVLALQVGRNAESMLRGRTLRETELTSASYGLPVYYPAYDTDQRVHPLPYGMLSNPPGGGNPSAPTYWTLNDRSSPSTQASVGDRRLYWVPLVQDSNPATASHLWRIYVFVLLRWPNVNYNDGTVTRNDWANPDDSPDGVPRVRRAQVTPSTADLSRLDFSASPTFNDRDNDGAADQLVIGDQLLDNNGNIYRVVGADPAGVNINGIVSASPNPVNEIWFAPPGLQPSTTIPSGQPSPTMMILAIPDGGTGGSIVQ